MARLRAAPLKKWPRFPELVLRRTDDPVLRRTDDPVLRRTGPGCIFPIPIGFSPAQDRTLLLYENAYPNRVHACVCVGPYSVLHLRNKIGSGLAPDRTLLSYAFSYMNRVWRSCAGPAMGQGKTRRAGLARPGPVQDWTDRQADR